MTSETLEQKKFEIMEAADEEQIMNADQAVKDSFAWMLNGKAEISYLGIKHLVLLMANKGHSMSVLEYKVDLVGDKDENKVWYATIKLRNNKTGHESVGMSEQSYLMGGKYDKFARTKALSKAERNACRKQIPELSIKKLMNKSVKDGKAIELMKNCSCKPGTNKVDMTKGVCLTCGGKLI